MKTRLRNLVAVFGFASVAFMGSVVAADKWFVLGEQSIKTANPSATIKSEGGRWDKDVKQVKISVEGADVKVSKIILSWDNRRDDTLKDIGTIKSGGETAPFNAPGITGRLTSATIYYSIEGNAPTATVKVWGYD